MADLPWNLKLVMSVRNALSSGQSVRWAVEDFLSRESGEDIRILKIWYLKHANQNEMNFPTNLAIRAVFELMEKGFRGESISQPLLELELEFIQACEEDIERFASILPLHLMAVLTLFVFPALMLVLVGPILLDLLRFK